MPDSDHTKTGRFAIVSLGCPKNLVDSEVLAGRLEAAGHRLVGRAEQADFVVVNTCSFVETARRESAQVIEEMLDLKRRGAISGLIVAGCLPERDRDSLLARYPEIDALVGVFARDAIAEAAACLLAGTDGRRAWFGRVPDQVASEAARRRLTVPHVAYLKVAEGCSRACSFCTIPQIRGPRRSKPIELVVEEARQLAANGARELVLVAQDTSSYGVDLYGRSRLAELLARIDQLDGPAWIRLMYLYPSGIDDELIEVLASGTRILPYLDLPLQHISDRLLRAMRRGVTRLEVEQLLERLRTRIERLVVRTTLMTGFPGETEADFAELLQFVEQQRFERLGVFAWSCEPGTPAAALPEQLPESLRHTRRERLLEAQQSIAFEFARRQVGRRLDVLIDGPLPAEPGVFVGRTWADAPEIDPVVYVTVENAGPHGVQTQRPGAPERVDSPTARAPSGPTGPKAANATGPRGENRLNRLNRLAGRIVGCEIVAAKEYDLIGLLPG